MINLLVVLLSSAGALAREMLFLALAGKKKSRNRRSQGRTDKSSRPKRNNNKNDQEVVQ